MHFDLFDETEPNVRLLELRNKILQGASVNTSWREVAKKHPFFHDVAIEAEKQAIRRATVLAAAEFLVNELFLHSHAHEVANFADKQEIERLRASIVVFQSLYGLSPTPTRKEWIKEVRRFGYETIIKEYTGTSCSTSSPKMNGKEEEEEGEGESEGEEESDDGTVVESMLKDLLTRCLLVGRGWCRQRCEDTVGDRKKRLRQAMTTVDSFLESRSLEW
ncbi:hypothetical protein ERJ75_001730100 [Trypanosoma vivax]|nr:hypothetical protein TRVL_09197 [Trypanosoma vivax]KAH8604310.1 hypothetical protein ERJ75_001730100 [Trypanosoma vivax]